MPDPLTLSALGTTALTEGIEFLYREAGEVLKLLRERGSAGTAEAQPTGRVSSKLPANAFEGQLNDPVLHLDVVEELQAELRELRAAVAEYAQGIDEVDPSNRTLLEQVDGLRRALEAVYGQSIRFKGEPDPSSGTAAVGEAKVGEVRGYVAGLRARNILGGSVTGKVYADRVDAGGTVVGVDVDTFGPSAHGPGQRQNDDGTSRPPNS
jgi:hypothetical protein